MTTTAHRGPAEVPAALVGQARAVRAEVADLLSGSGEPSSEPSGQASGADADRRRLARQLAIEILDREAASLLADGREPLPAAAEQTVVDLVVAMLFGLGVLQLFIDDPAVENIDVNGAAVAFVTYADGRKERVGPIADSNDELVSMVRAGAARFGLSERRFDAGQPELDLRLPDGSRLSAVMAVTEHPVVDIRRHRLADHTLGDLVELGALDDELAALLAAAVRARRNILVSGAMNAGKTTLLRALAAEIPARERIVTIEQALELGLDRQRERHPDCVAMEARLANTEGVGAIGMAQLVRRSLRMNASRVIVGEVLGDEVVPMLNAMSQGCSGSMGTIHADSSAGVFRRLASYAIQAPERLPIEATNLLIAGAIHLVVHLESSERPAPSDRTGSEGTGDGPLQTARYVASVREVVDAEGPLVISNEIWRPGPGGRAVPAAPLRDGTAALLAGAGYGPERLDQVGAW